MPLGERRLCAIKAAAVYGRRRSEVLLILDRLRQAELMELGRSPPARAVTHVKLG